MEVPCTHGSNAHMSLESRKRRRLRRTCPVRTRAPHTAITALCGPDAMHERILSSLDTHTWLHLACHGIQDTGDPFQSRFLLHDGDSLQLVNIVGKDLPHAELAFLSACHSARGDSAAYDEAIHLAAGMQFAGYKSVVGTMWSMGDADGPVVAREFYKHVVSSKGRMIYEESAEALAKAMRKLRRAKVPLERWICFVHYGL